MVFPLICYLVIASLFGYLCYRIHEAQYRGWIRCKIVYVGIGLVWPVTLIILVVFGFMECVSMGLDLMSSFFRNRL